VIREGQNTLYAGNAYLKHRVKAEDFINVYLKHQVLRIFKDEAKRPGAGEILFSCFLDKLTIRGNLLLPLGISRHAAAAVAGGAALAADGCWRFGDGNWDRCRCAWRERDSHGDRSRRGRRGRSSRNRIGLFHNVVRLLFLKRRRETWFDNQTWTRRRENSGFCR